MWHKIEHKDKEEEIEEAIDPKGIRLEIYNMYVYQTVWSWILHWCEPIHFTDISDTAWHYFVALCSILFKFDFILLHNLYDRMTSCTYNRQNQRRLLQKFDAIAWMNVTASIVKQTIYDMKLTMVLALLLLLLQIAVKNNKIHRNPWKYFEELESWPTSKKN